MGEKTRLATMLGWMRANYPQARWLVGLFLFLQFVWRIWNGAGDMIDTLGHAQFLAEHRTEAVALTKAVIAAIFSPTGSMFTFIFGFLFLYLDRRFASEIAPTQSLPGLPKESKQLVIDTPEVSGTQQVDDNDFPIKERLGTTAIEKREDRSIYWTDRSGTDALVACFTNEDLSLHLVGARLMYSRADSGRPRGTPLRIIGNPVWLGRQGNFASFAVHETHYLVLAVENSAHPKQWYSLEDHRLTTNAKLGIESRELDAIKMSMEIELTLDGSKKKSFHFGANFKTLTIVPKTEDGDPIAQMLTGKSGSR